MEEEKQYVLPALVRASQAAALTEGSRKLFFWMIATPLRGCYGHVIPCFRKPPSNRLWPYRIWTGLWGFIALYSRRTAQRSHAPTISPPMVPARRSVGGARPAGRQALVTATLAFSTSTATA
jgi:hypothetical protein